MNKQSAFIKEESHEIIVKENEEEKHKELKKELKRKRARERQRAYYHRQKDLKKNEKKKKKAPKTNAERQREFRQRQAEKYYVDNMKRRKLRSNEENVVQESELNMTQHRLKIKFEKMEDEIEADVEVKIEPEEDMYQDKGNLPQEDFRLQETVPSKIIKKEYNSEELMLPDPQPCPMIEVPIVFPNPGVPAESPPEIKLEIEEMDEITTSTCIIPPSSQASISNSPLAKPTTTAVKKRSPRPFTATEKTMICNMFKSLKTATPITVSHNDICKTVADSLGVHWVSVYRAIREEAVNGFVKSPKKTKTRLAMIDKIYDCNKCAIRSIVHNFFLRNEFPSLNKIMKEVEKDGTLGSFKRTSLHKILQNIGFKFTKRSKNTLLIDKDDVFFRRRSYLRAVKEARRNGRRIYYLDETLINERHTNSTVSGLIITHIGSEEGFVQDGLNVVKSKKQANQHQDMDAELFENWFSSILNKLEENSVIVMDNAPCRSRKVENIPTAMDTKLEIIDWLRNKNIVFEEDLLKRELLNIVKMNRNQYDRYVIDVMAQSNNISILRLPPYHSDLNPLESIWTEVKEYIATQNKSSKLSEIILLVNEAIQKIDANKWKDCIRHVREVIEPKMDEMDRNVESMTENFSVNMGSGSSDSSESDC